MGILVSDRVENIVGKEEITRYKQFLLSPQCFQKLSVIDALKWVSTEKRNNNFSNFDVNFFSIDTDICLFDNDTDYNAGAATCLLFS